MGVAETTHTSKSGTGDSNLPVSGIGNNGAIIGFFLPRDSDVIAIGGIIPPVADERRGTITNDVDLVIRQLSWSPDSGFESCICYCCLHCCFRPSRITPFITNCNSLTMSLAGITTVMLGIGSVVDDDFDADAKISVSILSTI